MSNNSRSQVGGKRTPPQANNSQDGARSKGSSKKDKKLSGKDKKTKEEIKKKKDVNNKKCVLAPPEPVPSNIELSSEGKNEVLTPEAKAMTDCYSGMIDHMCKEMKAISLNKKDYESLKEAKTVEERIKVLYDCGSSCLCDPKFKEIIRRKVLKEVGGKRTPPQASNSQDGAKSKGPSKKKDKKSSGKDKKLKEEIKKKEDVNNKKRVLAPPEPVPSNIELSSEGNDEVLMPEAVVVANIKTGTVTVEDVELFIFNCLSGATTDKRIKDLFELNFSHLCDYFWKVVNQRKVSKEATIDKRIKDLYELNFSHLCYYYWKALKIRKANVQGEKDKKKFDVARKFGKDHLDHFRKVYQQGWISKEMPIRQRDVELYLLDKLALRVGDKGCCSLEVGHIKLHEEDEGQEFVVEFDFLGKDSIRYQNKVPVEKRVYENIKEFMERKEKTHLLLDKVTPSKLNSYLESHMLGLTASVFRTYNASITLQNKLEELTAEAEETVTSPREERLKLMRQVHVKAVQAAAALLNHKCADPKKAKLKAEIKTLETNIEKTKEKLESVQNEIKQSGNKKEKWLVNQESKVAEELKDQLDELTQLKAKYAEEGYKLNVSTTVNNYLDPRISVAWCMKKDVPVDTVFTRAQRDKFSWAISMAEDLLNYKF